MWEVFLPDTEKNKNINKWINYRKKYLNILIKLFKYLSD